ncbi:MAG TPA: AsmA-like C-terminal region-containing protein, partial [Candidatus Obscuribacter sp.]|nr:AsmA-like C-terminal region-containing protein [Candidatus Obscuribacter sp.]
IQKGIVARFGQLQTKLTQANLLSQGILGFNINNLLQSVAPARSGEFNELTSRFQIFKGALAIKELRFSGDDLRLWGAGAADLSEQTIDLEIAGTLPRVTESFLGGTIGRLSRNITVSGLLSKVTFGALENLPSLPILGDIASDKPRAFAFKVQAPAQDAKLVAKSIEKTFRFLPNRQAASAHPVPGL